MDPNGHEGNIGDYGGPENPSEYGYDPYGNIGELFSENLDSWDDFFDNISYLDYGIDYYEDFSFSLNPKLENENSFGISLSYSSSLLGKGTTKNIDGFERTTFTAFDFMGASIDINIGNKPNQYQDVVCEIGLGEGKYFGVSYYFYGADAYGNPEYGGITIHIGIGIGTPAYISGSMADDSKVRFW